MSTFELVGGKTCGSNKRCVCFNKDGKRCKNCKLEGQNTCSTHSKKGCSKSVNVPAEVPKVSDFVETVPPELLLRIQKAKMRLAKRPVGNAGIVREAAAVAQKVAQLPVKVVSAAVPAVPKRLGNAGIARQAAAIAQKVAQLPVRVASAAVATGVGAVGAVANTGAGAVRAVANTGANVVRAVGKGGAGAVRVAAAVAQKTLGAAAGVPQAGRFRMSDLRRGDDADTEEDTEEDEEDDKRTNRTFHTADSNYSNSRSGSPIVDTVNTVANGAVESTTDLLGALPILGPALRGLFGKQKKN
jgi:hypothetical protein